MKSISVRMMTLEALRLINDAPADGLLKIPEFSEKLSASIDGEKCRTSLSITAEGTLKRIYNSDSISFSLQVGESISSSVFDDYMLDISLDDFSQMVVAPLVRSLLSHANI